MYILEWILYILVDGNEIYIGNVDGIFDILKMELEYVLVI